MGFVIRAVNNLVFCCSGCAPLYNFQVKGISLAYYNYFNKIIFIPNITQFFFQIFVPKLSQNIFYSKHHYFSFPKYQISFKFSIILFLQKIVFIPNINNFFPKISNFFLKCHKIHFIPNILNFFLQLLNIFPNFNNFISPKTPNVNFIVKFQ